MARRRRGLKAQEEWGFLLLLDPTPHKFISRNKHRRKKILNAVKTNLKIKLKIIDIY